MGQFTSTDFVRQNSLGILRSRKLTHRIKLLGKTRGLNLIKRKKRKKKKKPREEQNIWRHTWRRSDSLPRTDGSNGNTENGWLAQVLFCLCRVLSSSLQFPEAQQKCQQLFPTEDSQTVRSTETMWARTGTEGHRPAVYLPSALPHRSSCFRRCCRLKQMPKLFFHQLTGRSWSQHPNKQEFSKQINSLFKGLPHGKQPRCPI